MGFPVKHASEHHARHEGIEMGYKAGLRCPIGESEGDPASAPRGRFPQGVESHGGRDSSRQGAIE